MNPEQWQRVKELCGAAMRRAPGERARFLAEACADDSMRREVEALLAAYESKFMERPAVGEVAEMVAAINRTVSLGYNYETLLRVQSH